MHSLNKSWVYRGNHKLEITKCLKLNDNKSNTCQNQERYSAQRVIYILTCLKEGLNINEISLQIKKLKGATTKTSQLNETRRLKIMTKTQKLEVGEKRGNRND